MFACDVPVTCRNEMNVLQDSISAPRSAVSIRS